ncbi:MAG: polysulfide reductase NrfD [Armatimonadetes bacterium]|nr:polysulfide reductase NrfD [Armatimonadota bacterium]
MRLGFVIDQTACIGCHACTVACKAENDVPVGSFRTWVTQLERGVYPDVKRSFLVQRCNQCTDAPCVTICPVNALIKRPDGIVDVDRDLCIGCRACMQACPYDAIYMNDGHGAVEKCHFCAHRVDRGLEPACVTVCPVSAIIPGDLDDPRSKASQLIRNVGTTVRRPEQGTGPNVFYIGADEAALKPGSAARPNTYFCSERPPQEPKEWPDSLPLEKDTIVVHDVAHRVEWGWPVALYMVTKGIAAGVMMLAPFVAAFGVSGFAANFGPEILALAFTSVTTFLLIEDLARPKLFYRLLTRANGRSWLVKGAVVLGAFTLLVLLSLAARFAGLSFAADILRWASAALAVGVAGYTAFLYAQCKGRDLWESPLLLPHLLVQAILCGSAVLTLPFSGGGAAVSVFVASCLAHAALALLERHRRQETDNARQAAAFLGTVTLGPFRAFRDGLIIGVALPILLVFVAPVAAAVLALLGLFLYEHAYVRAAQLPPLS